MIQFGGRKSHRTNGGVIEKTGKYKLKVPSSSKYITIVF